MTREEFVKQLDGMAFNGENLGKFLRENYTLSEPTKTDTKRGAIDKGKVLDILIKHQIEINFDAFDEMWEEVDALPFIKPTTITENMTNGDVIKAMFPDMRKKGTYCEFFFDDTKAIQTNSYMHVSEHWFNAPYKGNFTMPTRPKAKWIERDLESYNPITRDRKIYVCSNCHLGIDSSVNRFANYCPNCGAEMESE